jgi:hypothetical protein
MSFSRRLAPLLTAVLLAGCPAIQAQSAAELLVLRGLAPVSALQSTPAGKAALAANFAVTAAIQDGSAHQPALLPFAAQQAQSLRDGFITSGNAANLADALGSTLAPIYQSGARYSAGDDGRTFSFTSLSPALAEVLGYAYDTAHADAGLSKFFFGSGTQDGSQPASAEALAVFTGVNGTPDVFGRTYGLPPGSQGEGAHGNPRPFQTRGRYLAFEGKDYFGRPSSNTVYLRGPVEDNTGSPSFPSGHATYGYTEALVLAQLVPERYPQLVARAAEYANERIVLGAHYAMDVLGARTLAEHDIAHLLAGTPGYVRIPRGPRAIEDFRAALAVARADLDKVLTEGCGKAVSSCAQEDGGRFSDAQRNEAFYESTQTYGLPAVYGHRTGIEDVGKLAPEAGYLLTVAFPYLSLVQADAILTATEGPGGGFLDNGSSFGVYSRLDLYRAAKAALAAAPRARGPRAASR